jgi:chemotaxis regulatin CheY-phosphate phosphatase CheZ
MKSNWSYKHYEVKEGLKPGSNKFRYFYVVSESGQKKANYCVWIVDNALSDFDETKDFDAIASSHADEWRNWVKGKIDVGDFRNRVRKFDTTGETEIDLSEMTDHVSMD